MSLKQLIVIFSFCLIPTAVSADKTDPYQQDRLQLRQILKESQQGINTQTLHLFTQHIDAQARVTFLNGEVAVGPKGVKDYFDRMVGESEHAILNDYQTHADVIGKARFYGNVAVANGTMHDIFKPKARQPFAFDSRWTVTFAKETGVWKIVALHFSTNAFNNSLTDELRSLIKQYAAYAFLAGLCLGGLLLLWKTKTNKRVQS